jgi:hypothetical protein
MNNFKKAIGNCKWNRFFSWWNFCVEQAQNTKFYWRIEVNPFALRRVHKKSFSFFMPNPVILVGNFPVAAVGPYPISTFLWGLPANKMLYPIPISISPLRPLPLSCLFQSFPGSFISGLLPGLCRLAPKA